MRFPFVISVPHCSYHIPREIEADLALTEREILESTDIGTRELFTNLPVRVTLWSRWSRLVVDLNRDPTQLDDMGVVPYQDYYGRQVYKAQVRPDQEEVARRLKTYYRPYHHRLREAVEAPEIKVLFDCHSLKGVGPPKAPDPLKWRKDIVLGNLGDDKGNQRPGQEKTTCPKEHLMMMKEVFNKYDFSVSINRPYAGGYITSHYGEGLVKQGKMAVQVEINEELYLDGARMRLRMDRVADIANRFQKIFREIGANL
jgi:N-formylglutamate amidohydrolase